MELALFANQCVSVCLTNRTVTGPVELHDVGVVDPGQLATLWRKHPENVEDDTHKRTDYKHMTSG